MTYHRTEVAIGKLSQEKNLLLDIVKIALDTYKELLQEKMQIKKLALNNLDSGYPLVTLCDPCVQGSHLGRPYIQKFFFK